MNIEIQLEIICEYGSFLGEILNVSDEQYKSIIEMSKNFYETGFEMSTENGGFIILPPEIVRKSILKINLV